MSSRQRAWVAPAPRFMLHDGVPAGATALDLPARSAWPANLVVGLIFLIFAAVDWSVVRTLDLAVGDVFDLVVLLFRGLWVAGWSVGVLLLGGLALLLGFYSESAWLQPGRLIHVPRLGPLRILLAYDLGRVRNLRLEPVAGEGVRLRFDYGGRTTTLGSPLPKARAEELLQEIQAASSGIAAPAPAGTDLVEQVAPRQGETRTTSRRDREDATAPPSLTSTSGLALVLANLIPLAGVLFFHWNLANVMLLFWAESAVIGFYTVLKIAVVGRFLAFFAGPFFASHFGGFMAMHFLFIYLLFVRGMYPSGLEPGVRDALAAVFRPLWSPLAVLVVSHGVSFVSNFLGQREYEGASVAGLMLAPYERVMVMQLAIILGGWIVVLFHEPAGALALLVVLKTALDLSAHRREHG